MAVSVLCFFLTMPWVGQQCLLPLCVGILFLVLVCDVVLGTLSSVAIILLMKREIRLLYFVLKLVKSCVSIYAHF